MKYFVACLLISVAVAYPQAGPAPSVIGNAAGNTAPVAAGGPVNPWGPKAYGPGLNNPYALPPNQFLMTTALNLANLYDGLLVRVDTRGEITLTDQFGRKVEAVYDQFGRDLSDAFD